MNKISLRDILTYEGELVLRVHIRWFPIIIFVANYRLKSNRSGQTDRSISRTSNDLTLKVVEV